MVRNRVQSGSDAPPSCQLGSDVPAAVDRQLLVVVEWKPDGSQALYHDEHLRRLLALWPSLPPADRREVVSLAEAMAEDRAREVGRSTAVEVRQ